MADCFDILGVPKDAGLAEVKAAYRRMAEIYHPDKGGDGKEFMRISLAYKQAIDLATQPILCAMCNGLGVIEHRSGWSKAEIICAICNGKGEVKRD